MLVSERNRTDGGIQERILPIVERVRFEFLSHRQSAALKRIPAPLEAGIRSVHYPHSASCISLAELPEGRFTSPTAAYRRDDEDRLLFLIPMFRSATCGAVLFVGMSFSKFTNVAS